MSVAAYTFSEYPLTGAGDPVHVEGAVVTANLFPLLGVQPALGRGFLPGEDAPGHHVAILSDLFWRAHFNGDKNVVGRNITLRGYS